MKVYRLKHGPRGEYAVLRGTDEPGDTQMIDGFWGKSMIARWQKVHLTRRIESPADAIAPLSDYAEDVSFPLFGQRSVNALKDMLYDNGELLPALCDEAPYWYYNPTTLLDALDEGHSEFYGTPRQIQRYVFTVGSLKDASIFKIPQKARGTRVFVTDRFVARVVASGLTGFEPLLVWSDEDDVIRRFDIFDLPIEASIQ
jgi:hypothetical protein